MLLLLGEKKKDTMEISSMHCGKSWLPGKLVVRENYEGKQRHSNNLVDIQRLSKGHGQKVTLLQGASGVIT